MRLKEPRGAPLSGVFLSDVIKLRDSYTLCWHEHQLNVVVSMLPNVYRCWVSSKIPLVWKVIIYSCCIISDFIHLKLELLKQFPASNNENGIRILFSLLQMTKIFLFPKLNYLNDLAFTSKHSIWFSSNPAWFRIFREILCFSPLNLGTLLRCCVLGQGTSPSNLKCFTWLRWKWVPGRTEMAMCTISSMCRNGCKTVSSPWSWNGTRMNRSSDQGLRCKVGW